jgi:ribosomal protein S18 acetylase RimI-like enzyme
MLLWVTREHSVAKGATSIVIADSEPDLSDVRLLFREYIEALPFELTFQDYERELAELPAEYAPPDGRLLLARRRGEAAGCVGLRRLEPGICEMKRLYVRPNFRGLGLGTALSVSIIDIAREIGYSRMRLDTISAMDKAIGLYRSLGFRDIPPYRFNPIEGATYMELGLT